MTLTQQENDNPSSQVTEVLYLMLKFTFLFNFMNFINVLSKTSVIKTTWKTCKTTFYHADRALQLFNFGHYLDNENENENEDDENNNTIVNTTTNEEKKEEGSVVQKPEVKYELKYLEEYRQQSKEFKYTWERYDQRQKQMDQIRVIKHAKVKEEIADLNADMVSKGLIYIDRHDDSLEQEIATIRKAISVLEKKLTSKELEDEIKEEAHQSVLNTYLDGLKNSFVMEKTPLGNVLMYYNNSRKSFEYYSDNTIPYRYLETVARKYVLTFHCAYLYVDMEQELLEADKKAKEALEKEQKEKELKEQKEKEKEKQLKESSFFVENMKEPKKDVFAKFKSYNKEAVSGRVNTGAPPKNSIPNMKIPSATSNSTSINNTNNPVSNTVLLKENANRYTCEGKMCNFSFIKKPDRKVVDKKYAMSFADFKKMKK